MQINLPKIDKIAGLSEFKNCNKNKILSLAKDIISTPFNIIKNTLTLPFVIFENGEKK